MYLRLFPIFTIMLLLSGCATNMPLGLGLLSGMGTQPDMPVETFSDPQNRDHSQVVLDQASCGAVNGTYENQYAELYHACMDKRGYILIKGNN